MLARTVQADTKRIDVTEGTERKQKRGKRKGKRDAMGGQSKSLGLLEDQKMADLWESSHEL